MTRLTVNPEDGHGGANRLRLPARNRRLKLHEVNGMGDGYSGSTSNRGSQMYKYMSRPKIWVVPQRDSDQNQQIA